MSRLGVIFRPVALVCGLLAAGAGARAGAGAPDLSGIGSMPPFRMVRTLEYVQDSIVGGDHGAAAMQSYLLHAIDERLRRADPSVFDDSRNADAALIYAMSGGNPETLRLVAKRDIDGNFDHALTDALLTYFSGKPEQARPELEALEPTFRNTDLGPYVTLVTANAEAQRHPEAALILYDWVRLLAPGSILEESALRRSIDLAVRMKRADKGIEYSRDYARRFLHSPYARQFAALFVQLVVDDMDAISSADVAEVLSHMDETRQAAIYLRIARAAAIAGKYDLARASAIRAGQLSKDGDGETASLAAFYKGVADIPSPEVQTASQSVRAMPTDKLSRRDQALRQAALSIALQVTEPAGAAKPADTAGAHRRPVRAQPVSRQPIESRPVRSDAQVSKKAEKAFNTFIEARRDKLEAIDDLLKKATE